MRVQESLENYLETILVINNRKGNVRSIDVVHELGFTKASVSVAMKNLRNKGYITVNEDGYLNLTEEGMYIAKKVYERHTLILDLLVRLGVDKEIAEDDACRIEHVISDETFDAIKKYAATLD